jgi:hypothetical protein
MDPIEFLSRFFPPRGDVFHLTSMYIAISHHSISRPRSLFFSSPCCRGWISLYTTRKPSSFFLILSDFSHFFFFYWIRSWIIQKKGYTYYTAPCVCIYSPEGWMPLLYRMDVCIYRWSCQQTSRSLARISPASIHIAPVYDCLTLGLKVSYRFSFRASVTFLHSFILMLRGWGAVCMWRLFILGSESSDLLRRRKLVSEKKKKEEISP